MRIKKLIFALLALTLKNLVKVDSKKWIIGSDKGNFLSGNSKYYLFYHTKNQKAIRLIFISKSKQIVEEYAQKGIETFYNYSLKGLYHILSSRVYIFSTTILDIDFVNKKKAVIINLWHGMPIKKILYDNSRKHSENNNLGEGVVHYLLGNIKWPDVTCNVVLSEYFGEIFKSATRNQNSFVLGQARDDIFYRDDINKIKQKAKNKIRADGKKIISYLPTHRKFGLGDTPKALFSQNPEAISFFREQNYVVITKNHINMMDKIGKEEQNECIMHLSHDSIDTQDLLIATDILITDYSGLLFDFLHLNKPILFYHYDDYIKEDHEIYFNCREDFPGTISKNEDDLLLEIKKIAGGYDDFVNARVEKFKKYCKYHDGNSSKRIFEKILELSE